MFLNKLARRSDNAQPIAESVLPLLLPLLLSPDDKTKKAAGSALSTIAQHDATQQAVRCRKCVLDTHCNTTGAKSWSEPSSQVGGVIDLLHDSAADKRRQAWSALACMTFHETPRRQLEAMGAVDTTVRALLDADTVVVESAASIVANLSKPDGEQAQVWALACCVLGECRCI